MTTNEIASGWNKSQAKSFAREIWTADFEGGRAVKYMTPKVRAAVVDAAILGIVRRLDRVAVSVAAIDALYADVHAAVIALSNDPDFFD